MLIFRTLYRTRILIIIALVLLLMAPAAFASQLDDKRVQLQDLNAQIDATKGKQDDAAKRQQEVSLQIQLSDQKMVELQKKLNDLQTQLNDVIAKKQTAEAKLNETQKRLDGEQTNLAATKEKLALRQEAFNARLIGTYKSGKQSVLEVLVNATSFVDLMNRIDLVGIIADSDSKLIEGMKQLSADISGQIMETEAIKKAVEQQRLELIAEKKHIDGLTNGVIAQQKQIQDEVAKQQQLYAQIQQEKDRLAQAESQLKASANAMVEQIRMLESQGSSAGGAFRSLNISADLRDLAAKAAEKYGIPTNLFFALITQESGWNYRAVSSAGAIGLTQVMPFNVIAWGYNLESFKNSPSDQLELGAGYLSMQYKTFGRWDFALAAYNAGPGTVLKVREGYPDIPFGETKYYPSRETRNYVRNILAMAGMQ